MKGTDFPNQWVMRGNHHDAWVHGANDPVSGMVALMEEARAIGELGQKRTKTETNLGLCRMGCRGTRTHRFYRMG